MIISFQTARRLKLKDMPGFEEVSGGQAIERLAEGGDPRAFDCTPIMTHHADCNFSFAGIKMQMLAIIAKEELRQSRWSSDVRFVLLISLLH